MSKLNDLDSLQASYETMEKNTQILERSNDYLCYALTRTREVRDSMAHKYLDTYEQLEIYKTYQERLNTAAAHITGLPELLEVWQTKPLDEHPAGYSFYLELYSVLSDHVYKRRLQLLQRGERNDHTK